MMAPCARLRDALGLDERPLGEAVLEALEVVAEARLGHVEDDRRQLVDERAGRDAVEAHEAVEELAERLALGHRQELVVVRHRLAVLRPPGGIAVRELVARLGERRHLGDHPREADDVLVHGEGEEGVRLGARRHDELERRDVVAVLVDDGLVDGPCVRQLGGRVAHGHRRTLLDVERVARHGWWRRQQNSRRVSGDILHGFAWRERLVRGHRRQGFAGDEGNLLDQPLRRVVGADLEVERSADIGHDLGRLGVRLAREQVYEEVADGGAVAGGRGGRRVGRRRCGRRAHEDGGLVRM